VDDEVRLVLWALDNQGTSGTYNAVAPHSVTNREFSRALGRVLRRPAVVPVPELALKVRFGSELGEIVTGGQRAVPRRAVDEGFEFRHPELEPALRDLMRG
jgi:NAD dependent epimerase/dehydratase family enzyme